MYTVNISIKIYVNNEQTGNLFLFNQETFNHKWLRKWFLFQFYLISLLLNYQDLIILINVREMINSQYVQLIKFHIYCQVFVMDPSRTLSIHLRLLVYYCGNYSFTFFFDILCNECCMIYVEYLCFAFMYVFVFFSYPFNSLSLAGRTLPDGYSSWEEI